MAHCPQALWQLQELHCPPGSEAVHCRSCTAHCPQTLWQLQELHCPLPPGSEAVHCRSCTAHWPSSGRAHPARHPSRTPPWARGAACEGQMHHCHTQCTCSISGGLAPG